MYLLNDFENLAVVALRDDELVDVLLPLDLNRGERLQKLGRCLLGLLPVLWLVVLKY